MITMHIKTEKIREVIGKGGEVIQKIVADTGAKIDIEEDGTIYIAAENRDSGLAAQKIIEGICFEPEVGAIYTGTVTRIIPIGAFVEFAPGKEGMVHIKDLDTKFVENVEDICNVGDTLVVKFLGVDEKGRLNLSRKAALTGEDGSTERRPSGSRQGSPRGGKDSRRPQRDNRGGNAPRENKYEKSADTEVKAQTEQLQAVEKTDDTADSEPAEKATQEEKKSFFSIFKKN